MYKQSPLCEDSCITRKCQQNKAASKCYTHENNVYKQTQRVLYKNKLLWTRLLH